MTNVTTFYELRVREVTELTVAKALSAAAASLRLFSLFPPSAIGLSPHLVSLNHCRFLALPRSLRAKPEMPGN